MIGPPRKKRSLRAVGNYEQKIQQLIRCGWLAPEQGTTHALIVAHDDWCAIYKRRACDCDPQISIAKTP